MEEFTKLVDNLYFLNSNNAKQERLLEYLRNTPDPDRGWAIGAIANTINFEFFKRRLIKEVMIERVDPVLFDLSYDYVGEMSETVAHLWSSTVSESATQSSMNHTTNNQHAESSNIQIIENNTQQNNLPSLHEVITKFSDLPKKDVKTYLIYLLDIMTPTQRWALLKLGTGGLRIGMSARFLKKALSEYAQQNNHNLTVEDIERVWHGVTPPYIDLLNWIEGKANIPDIANKLTFQPVMLSHPLSEKDLVDIEPRSWQAEWKFDGVRAQLLANEAGVALYSRTGDDISNSFPDIIDAISQTAIRGRFDGELVALKKAHEHTLGNTSAEETPGMHTLEKHVSAFSNVSSFNQLQQRLNKKKPSKSLIQKIPTGLILYDVLELAQQDFRQYSLDKRFSQLKDYIHTILATHPTLPLIPSCDIAFDSYSDLIVLKEQAGELSNGYIEGLMLKKKTSTYISGRPKNQWFKLKRDPKVIDAVIMYAQRGHGKRSSYYSDYTFGCWQDGQLLPVGKAYSGFTDDELKKLDNWVRRNTVGRFGPVKEVKKELVFELAFDSVAQSNRHKSKIALRFPRVNRIRWDKPAIEADQLSTLVDMIESHN